MLSNNRLNRIIKENIHNLLLFESQESDSQKLAKNLYQQKTGCTREEADDFVRNTLRNDITSLRDKKIAKFTLGVTRMFLDRQITDGNTINDLNATLKLLTPHINEYDKNLNNLSAQELINRFKQVRLDNLENEKNEINSMSFGQSNYNIVRIDTFEQAKLYKQYTYSGSPWCLTYMENMFNNYTSGGINQIYFCLRNGFENIKPEVGDSAPLDEYGLSMLSVIVNENGELAYCTSRWNHENGGNDSVMNPKQISEVVDVNFYNTFKPNGKWNELITNVKQRLSNGENPKDIFDWVGNFSDGFARVMLNSKLNFINTDGKIICDQWFDNVEYFREGFAQVYTKGKDWNFINTDGKIICNQWFDGVSDFQEGFARVMLNGKKNFINTDGKIAFNQWFDSLWNFKNGFARVGLNDKENLINTDGEYLCNHWFDGIGAFNDGFAIVELNDKFNFINTDGEYLCNQWFDGVRYFLEGFAIVKLNDKHNFINTNGEILCDQWFDWTSDFSNGFAKVELNGEWNYLRQDGVLCDLNTKKPIQESKKINMKQSIRLTESEFKYLIKENIHNLLTEISIKDKYQKEKQKLNIPFDTFEMLCNLDPTTKPNKVGKYSNWIIAKYNQNANFNELKRCLEWYADGLKRGILKRYNITNDINQFKSYDDLIDTMNGLNENDDTDLSQSEYNQRQKLQGQFDILGSNNLYEIIQPHSFDAERYFGSGTSWCTVANKDYYYGYMSKGPLYILYPKNGDNTYKMQFHFETKSFADAEDNVKSNPLECIESVLQDDQMFDDVCSLCKNVFSEYSEYFMTFEERLSVIQQRLLNGENPKNIFDWVGDFYEGFAIVELNDKFNFINTNCEILCDQWFDEIIDFCNGLAIVKLKGKGYNYINKDGKIISKLWFNWVRDFYNGFASVELNGKCNFINTNGEILCDQWFDDFYSFSNGFIRVELNGKYNLINQDCKIICDQWFDDIKDFENSFAKVMLNGKKNLIDTDGKIAFDQWFDDVWFYNNGITRVELNSKYNFINQDGKIISKLWFDMAWEFSDGFSMVRLNVKGYNFINTEGEIVSDQWFDMASDFRYGFAIVKLNGKSYFLRQDGVLCNYDTKEPIQENKKSKLIPYESDTFQIGVENGNNSYAHVVAENYSNKYKLLAQLIKDGYLIHCTNENFEHFDPSYIKGGSRAKEGYGFYFTDMPYKPLEYGTNVKIVKKEDFNFIDANDNIDFEWLTNQYKIEKLTQQLYTYNELIENCRNIKEYNIYNDKIEEIKTDLQCYKQFNILFDYISLAIKSGAKTYGQLEYLIINPNKNVPLLSKLYIEKGIDGYYCNGIYTIFNFEKLNNLVQTINMEEQNINESLNISSFNIKKELNPNFWKDEKLDSRVRLKLLEIADDFTDFLNVDWVKPEDITMTGSLANYNWSKKHSDIDLHIIIDFKKVDKRIEFVKEYFDSKKTLWNQKHQDIKIFGFPIEVYVQDKNEPHASTGVYSLEKNEWKVKPQALKSIDKNVLQSISKRATSYATKIDNLINYKDNLTDVAKEKISNKLDSIFQDIKNKRKKGVNRGGELDKDNILFKMLRRNGYIDKIVGTQNNIYNDLMSINEGCWGYELKNDDKVLDTQNEFVQYIIQYLLKKLKNSDSKNPKYNDDSFSWFVLLQEFLLYYKNEEPSSLEIYQQALTKCCDYCEKIINNDFTKSYSEPQKMQKTLKDTLKQLKKCIKK